jgi:hypothetical protein
MMTDASTGFDAMLMQHIADVTMAWAAMDPVSRAFFAIGLGGVLAMLWLGFARVLDRSVLVWRPSRGFALGLICAVGIPLVMPPSISAFMADHVGPYLWRHARIVDGAGLATGAVIAAVVSALARRRWRTAQTA